MRGATIRSAQRAIDRRGLPLEIVRAPEGYHYFVYDVPARGIFETISVYEPYTSHRSPESWADIAACCMADLRRRLESYE